ncbi:aureusimine biosynthesis 4'-phosphopantetheinyl transferase AusB [Staphylococcus felis]|uniref:aureusimine biosynthesis 4'-phosphopantetheinyl transferase AusB n=1 Tax=Staphylococcus felis TaxID=46127 RepID=UPI000E2384B7|nr:4'-phosphopantetheinyl transferase superfamily protein [Staphylococcus felis]REI07864.1 hypothetical protein DOS66_09920 [Staphylococcus felis]
MILYADVSTLKSSTIHKIMQEYFYFKRDVTRYHFKRDRLRHRVGELLVHYGVLKYAKLRPNEWQFLIGEHGKIFIDAPQAPYISLSYSHHHIACIVSENPVGIDIEMIELIAWQHLKSQFTVDESKHISTLEDFYQVWTQKEAYSKLTGEGLLRGINQYNVQSPLYFQEYRVNFKSVEVNRVLIQVCDVDPNLSLAIEEVNIEQAIDILLSQSNVAEGF